ncbi:hypothetical protein Ais01nite_58280 [Asanoa ishikariensis]|uniref:Uncharacterized protein n=1 Tax=Asanoa ishikariensis TaxID=137265 RepID=A0A1H3V041_9ACTN|nr:hypothetical protein [Asanoa ishikariensis]GIF67793.1 hypothetical protein Ais01nite_58280 [Asanoa ishikariensis]SDZ67987.1 hypothetical protein SAMN05421684_0014 [Asanoa ishikariensis]
MTVEVTSIRTRSMTIVYYLVHALIVAVGAIITMINKPVATAIGTSLIATGAAGAVIYIYLIRTETAREALEMFNVFGLHRIYDRRAAQIRGEYASRLARANSKIDIIGFGLKDFRRDYIAELGALSQKTTIRILLLDPDSPLAAQRDKEEGQSVGTIAGEIREFATQFQQHYGKGSPTLSLRLYTCCPMINIFRIDNDIFWGPYFVGRASGNTATFRVRRGAILFDQLQQHFDEVWDKFSKPVES